MIVFSTFVVVIVQNRNWEQFWHNFLAKLSSSWPSDIVSSSFECLTWTLSTINNIPSELETSVSFTWDIVCAHLSSPAFVNTAGEVNITIWSASARTLAYQFQIQRKISGIPRISNVRRAEYIVVATRESNVSDVCLNFYSTMEGTIEEWEERCIEAPPGWVVSVHSCEITCLTWKFRITLLFLTFLLINIHQRDTWSSTMEGQMDSHFNQGRWNPLQLYRCCSWCCYAWRIGRGFLSKLELLPLTNQFQFVRIDDQELSSGPIRSWLPSIPSWWRQTLWELFSRGNCHRVRWCQSQIEHFVWTLSIILIK